MSNAMFCGRTNSAIAGILAYFMFAGPAALVLGFCGVYMGSMGTNADASSIYSSRLFVSLLDGIGLAAVSILGSTAMKLVEYVRKLVNA